MRVTGGGNGKHSITEYTRWDFDRGPEQITHTDGNNFDAWRAAQAGFRTDWAKSDRDSFTFQGDIYDEGAAERERD